MKLRTQACQRPPPDVTALSKEPKDPDSSNQILITKAAYLPLHPLGCLGGLAIEAPTPGQAEQEGKAVSNCRQAAASWLFTAAITLRSTNGPRLCPLHPVFTPTHHIRLATSMPRPIGSLAG